jgi:hypothetical protein
MERTLTFTVEDALLSPIGFSILSGAGLIKPKEGGKKDVHFHTTTSTTIGDDGQEEPAKIEIDLSDALGETEKISSKAPIYAILTEDDGSLTGDIVKGLTVDETGKKLVADYDEDLVTKAVMVDYYVIKNGENVSELQIDAENFAGYFYVEADTLFRRQSDGKDLPANITLPNIKIQSNFTFTMASSGDPSTFTFTMDAFPGYTMFDSTKKVLCVMQILEDADETEGDDHSVMDP